MARLEIKYQKVTELFVSVISQIVLIGEVTNICCWFFPSRYDIYFPVFQMIYFTVLETNGVFQVRIKNIIPIFRNDDFAGLPGCQIMEHYCTFTINGTHLTYQNVHSTIVFHLQAVTQRWQIFTPFAYSKRVRYSTIQPHTLNFTYKSAVLKLGFAAI